MEYKLDFMGLPLKNAVIVAAGPWAGDARSIQKCIDAGAAAVITETIVMEESALFGPRVYYENEELLNISLYGHRPLEEWEEQVERIHKKGSFLICSIRGSSPSELAYIARRAERLGADALQLDLFAPMDAMLEEINMRPEKLYEMTKCVTGTVKIPVMARLPHNISASTAYIRALERAGVSAISAIESLRGISGVDLENRRTKMPTYGGYTGKHIRPVSLAATATLSQMTDCQICGVGDVETYENILEFMMLGAATAQLGSVIMLKGYDVITETVKGLAGWMESHGCQSYGEIIGAALPTLSPYEKIERMRAVSCLTEPCGDRDCGLCVRGCMYEALTFGEDGVRCDPALCTGCGLCVQRCPRGILKLKKAPRA
ncbi:4Fe-4S dicluster domain-containing protein [Anaerotruncus massiliensis (ex Liu et al. 2021)]|uniref:4Fe-4S dicluster domain-containing protein n=1 Tax=Anaerotruncus massiliensis (ex Liu et al. 2021) TaxID=2321404 RepID=UPI003AF60969